ncbi:hypothetical protein VKT23_016332 [Stygiomarasmius scandens]|uniref:Uncharacterized protein n=1 Tax=Marasmiellus scandens TaxID=2682957 RepID=A0ABR1IYD6_9AGAR
MEWQPIVPIRGIPMAVDHEEEKLYLLTYHDDDGLEPGSIIHCLNLKTKVWDDSLHHVKSVHPFGNSAGQGKYLPPCAFVDLAFIKHRNGGKYLLIIGGYLGDPEKPNTGQYSRLNKQDCMPVIAVNISKRSWDFVHTVGTVRRRWFPAVAVISDSLYIFGGRKDVPTDAHLPGFDSLCDAEQLLESYSALTFDSASEQWIWTIQDRPFPKPPAYRNSRTPPRDPTLTHLGCPLSVP